MNTGKKVVWGNVPCCLFANVATELPEILMAKSKMLFILLLSLFGGSWLQFWNGDSTIKMSYILRVRATLYECYKGGHMSRTRWIFRYFTIIGIVFLCMALCMGCRKKSQETELQTVSVGEKETELTSEDSGEDGTKDDTGENEEDADKKKGDASTDTEGGPAKLYVHVCGHVNQPGVYELQPDSRVFEAIEAAGGMTATAAFSYLNQAELLQDGQQIYVPSQEEVDLGKVAAQAAGVSTSGSEAADAQIAENVSGQDDGKVNLNTATKEELMTLNGIGDVRAQAILKYREEHGEFRSIEELMEVEGIKKGTFQKLKDQIKI